MMRWTPWLVLLFLSWIAPDVLALDDAVDVRRWEHEISDIPVDPRIRFSTLDNGLRLAWIGNPEPDKRCYLRLHVDVGSLAETGAELGMAHFLEHMAFNGTKHFPAGTLIEWFQSHGMGFGADTNATTSFSETIYMIDLPTSDAESIADGLKVLRDFADGILLEEAEVEAEKGVIDGEERESDSAQRRMFVKGLRKRFAGTLFPDRIPIGIKSVRDEFSRETVLAFYKKWYRPDNMTLVVSGDLETLDPTALVKAAFGSLKNPPTKRLSEPSKGKPTLDELDFFIPEDEIPVVLISIDRLSPFEEEPTTVATWLEDLPVRYARSMLNLRFYERAKEEGAPFINASVGGGTDFEIFDGESLTVTCKPEQWREAITFCERELRSALLYGFQEAELEEVRAGALRSLDEAVARESTRSSRSYIGSILNAAENRSIPTNAETRRKIFREAILGLKVEICHKAFQEEWKKGTLAITGLGHLQEVEVAGGLLRKTWEASKKTAVEPPKKIEAANWAYGIDPSKKGKIKSRSHVEDLDFDRVEFANGVLLNVKKTDFKEKQIVTSCRFGDGMLSMDKKRPVLSFVGARAFNQGGLGAHSDDDIRRLTAGKVVGVGFGIGRDSFSLRGGTTAEDFPFQMEMIRAFLVDPGWREEGLRQFQKILPQYFESLEHQHGGPLSRWFIPEFLGGDPFFSFPKLEDAMGVKMEEIRDWIAPLLLESPIEVTVVGDLDVARIIESVAVTLGSLPKRKVRGDLSEKKKVAPPRAGMRESYPIQTAVPKTLVFLGFPTTDGIDSERRTRLSFLATVVNDRLRIEVREKLGASYSPGAGGAPSTVFPGHGYLMIQAMSDPDKADELEKACLEVAHDLATNGVTKEEIDRLREPELAQLRDAVRHNSYWMSGLSEAQSNPSSLDDLRSVKDRLLGVKAEDLSKLAKEFLKKERASILRVSPAAGSRD